MVFFLLIILFVLITNNEIVLSGATYGLMLWYKNLLPLLLPFMLISGIIENNILEKQKNQKGSISCIILNIFLLGLFCGYPIGAKTNSFFTKQGIIDKKTGNLILPICNNVSPMFFLGFILTSTLKNSLNPLKAYAAFYIPYIFILIIELIFTKSFITTTYTKDKPLIKTTYEKNNVSEQSIKQITMVGLYVMICSIITEFILSTNFFSQQATLILVGATEITRGITFVFESSIINLETKTALILCFASFGGISSIMQTAKVIQGSGLSLLHYITVKIVCAISTYYLCVLLI